MMKDSMKSMKNSYLIHTYEKYDGIRIKYTPIGQIWELEAAIRIGERIGA